MVNEMGCFVIAEAGVNHNGSEALALDLIDAAAQAGADAVKFQTFRAEKLVSPGTETAVYQRAHTGQSDQFSMLRALELPPEAYARLRDRCNARRIAFMSTPFDPESVDMLVALGMERIKVPSGEITNIPFLEYIAAKGLPIVLSTGMATLAEVARAVSAIRNVRKKKEFAASLEQTLTLLHCTSSYPAAVEDLNLRAMLTLKAEFGLPVGYSDHTLSPQATLSAVALGASVVEKHITLDRGLPGPDHQASMASEDFRRMVADIRAVESSLGTGEKAPRPSELPILRLVRRSVTLNRAVRRGEVVRREDLVLLRPGHGISPADLESVVGRRAAHDLSAGATLEWSDLLL